MPNISDQELKRISKAIKEAAEIKKRNQEFVDNLGPAIVNALGPAIKDALKDIQVNVNPEMKMPEIPAPIVNYTPPDIHVPEPRVTVNVPESRTPNVKVNMPTKALTNEMRAIKKATEATNKAISTQQEAWARDIVFPEYTRGKPMPVITVDELGKPWTPMTGASSRVAQMLKNQQGLIADFGEGSANTALRVVHASDVSQSVSVSGSMETKQVSGFVDSVNVVDAFGSTAVNNVWNSDNRLKVSVETGGSGLTDAELRASAVPVSQLSGARWSTEATQSGTWNIATLTDVTNSVTVSKGPEVQQIMGQVANDVADAGNPIKIGGIARQANPTAVTALDRVDATFDDLGRQVFRPIAVRDLTRTAYISLATGTETELVPGASGEFHDLLYVMCANESDAAVDVDFRSGTGGSVMFSITVPADGTAGVAPPLPLKQNEADQDWTADIDDITGTTVNIATQYSLEV